MKTRTATNLVLLVVIVITALILSLMQGKDGEVQTPRRLAPVDPGSVTSIQIRPLAGRPISLQRTGNRWQLANNGNLQANRFRVNAILELLQTPVVSSLAPEGLRLETFGLARPALELILDDHIFFFGGQAPLGHGRYVLYDNSIYIIADNLYPQLLQGPPFFVSTVLFNNDDPPIRLACDIQGQDTEVYDGDSIPGAWRELEANRVTAMQGSPATTGLTITTRSGKTLRIIPDYTGQGLALTVPEYAMAYHFPATMAAELGITHMACYH